MIAAISPRVRRMIAWTLVVTSCLGFVCLGLAERDVRGAVVAPVPDAPLPFARHKVVGIDLRSHSSLEALEILQRGGVAPYAIALAPIDPDIVNALTQTDARPAALAAMDQLVQAAQGVPLAACLWKPPTTVGGLGVAQAVAESLVERYPGAIAYLLACGPDEERAGWHADISHAVRGEDSLALPLDTLIPLSAGSPITLFESRDADQLGAAGVLAGMPGTDRYSAVVVPVTQPVSGSFVIEAHDLLTDLAALALVVARPERGVDPAALAASFGTATLDGAPLPEGFTSVTAPGIMTTGDWILSTVGTVPYARTTTDAAMAIEFVGTSVHVQALTSPDGGTLHGWIDPAADDPTAAPDIVVNLSDDQAVDAPIVLADGLPAVRHRLVLSASNDETAGQSISISGFVITGHATPEPVARLAAYALLLIAIVALGERALTNIAAIRDRETRLPSRTSSGHPRVFTRH